MNLGKIKRKLRREIGAHPAKAAILAILCVVALWFWAPLVAGWITPRGREAKTMATQQPVGPLLPGLSPAAMAAPAPDSQPTAPEYPWQQVVQWMEQDPRTQPVGSLLAEQGRAAAPLSGPLPWSPADTGKTDPFFRPQPAAAVAGDEDRKTPERLSPTPTPVSPQDAGASVTGVIAGPAGGAAVINGRAYREGEQVILQKDGVSFSFHLDEIRPGQVVLTRDGARYELKMPLPGDMR